MDMNNVLKRNEMRTLMRAAKQGWDTPAHERRRYVDLVQKVIDSPQTSPARRATAIQTMAAFRSAGWTQQAEPAVQ
jgi:hypothetical protein